MFPVTSEFGHERLSVTWLEHIYKNIVVVGEEHKGNLVPCSELGSLFFWREHRSRCKDRGVRVGWAIGDLF
jgi:hypothetical protein